MSISSPGIGSGLDVNSIVSKLVAVESAPVQLLQNKASVIQSEVSAFGTVKSDLASLQDAASALTTPDIWDSKTFTSSNATAITGTATSSAMAGSLSVQVNSLATSQSVKSAAVSSTAVFGAGSLSIQPGTWNSDGSFTASTTSPAVSISVSATDTLATIAASINNQSAAAGVSAQLVTSGSTQTLLLRGTSTGAVSGFQITPSGTGLDALGYYASTSTTQVPASTDPTTGVVTPAHYPAGGGLTQTQAASDASLTIEGVAVTSASNTVTDALSGVTLNLLTTTTTPAQVTMAVDNTAITAKIQAFQTAYNQMNTDLKSLTAYDATSKSGGPLLGDSTTTGIQSMLRSLIGASGPATSTIGRLSDLGLQIQADGSLSTNTTKLNAALQDTNNVKNFFSASTGSSSTDGIAKRIYDFAFGALGVGGQVTVHSAGFQTSLSQNADDITKFNAHIADYQKQLLAQYNALDTTMGTISSLNSFVSAQLAQWSKSS